MRTLFLDRHHRLRNGWWMLLFLFTIAATRVVYKPLTGGLRSLGVDHPWIELAPFLLVLGATWVCTRLRSESLADVGFRLDRRWFREASVGLLVGAASLSIAVAMIALSGGVRFALDPERSLSALATGLVFFLFVSLFEEALFRGFLFQRFVDGAGPVIAQFSLAVLFSAGHQGNPGMDGATQVQASIELGVAALLLGLAYLRTRSLALPVGLHLGWNWVQGSVFGLGVSGTEHAGWLQPVHAGPQWLHGGGFGVEASVFGLVADLLVLLGLWRWRGTVATTETPTGEAAVAP